MTTLSFDEMFRLYAASLIGVGEYRDLLSETYPLFKEVRKEEIDKELTGDGETEFLAQVAEWINEFSPDQREALWKIVHEEYPDLA